MGLFRRKKNKKKSSDSEGRRGRSEKRYPRDERRADLSRNSSYSSSAYSRSPSREFAHYRSPYGSPPPPVYRSPMDNPNAQGYPQQPPLPPVAAPTQTPMKSAGISVDMNGSENGYTISFGDSHVSGMKIRGGSDGTCLSLGNGMELRSTGGGGGGGGGSSRSSRSSRTRAPPEHYRDVVREVHHHSPCGGWHQPPPPASCECACGFTSYQY